MQGLEWLPRRLCETSPGDGASSPKSPPTLRAIPRPMLGRVAVLGPLARLRSLPGACSLRPRSFAARASMVDASRTLAKVQEETFDVYR